VAVEFSAYGGGEVQAYPVALQAEVKDARLLATASS
jgi:hypothetical protein